MEERILLQQITIDALVKYLQSNLEYLDRQEKAILFLADAIESGSLVQIGKGVREILQNNKK